RLEKLKTVIQSGVTTSIDARLGIFFSETTSTPRIGFLFPGQGSPSHIDGGALRRRFDYVQELYAGGRPAADGNGTTTVVAQPAIITASVAALRILRRLNVTA